MKLRLLILVIFLSGYSSTAEAHHPAAIGNSVAAGPITTISADTLKQGAAALALDYERTGYSGLGDGRLLAAAAQDQHVHSVASIQGAAASASFGVTDEAMVSIRLPYVIRSDIRSGHHDTTGLGPPVTTVEQHGDAESIGDLTLLGKWRFLNDGASRLSAALLAGFKAPTGSTDETDSTGELFATEFQPGTGAFDGLLGVSISRDFGVWALHGNVLHQFVTTGTQDTNLGDRLQYNAAIAYRIWGPVAAADPSIRLGHVVPSDSATAHLVLELNGEWQGQKTEAGTVDPHSGGNVVYFSPGIRLLVEDVSLFASIGVPIATHLNGLQSESSYRIRTGIGRAF